MCMCVCLRIDLGQSELRAFFATKILLFRFYQFYSKVRSPFQLGCAGFNLILVACAIVVCVCVHRVSVHLICSSWKKSEQIVWQAGPAHIATSPACTRTKLAQIACVLIFRSFVFICKRINLFHICSYQRTRAQVNECDE